MPDEELTDELDPDEETDAKLAGYLLGRDLWLIQGWLASVHGIASMPGRPWEWQWPDTIFGRGFDSPPSDRMADVNDSLVALVRAKSVDAAVLVELHRFLDEVAEGCVTISDYAYRNSRKQLVETYWTTAYALSRAIELERQLIMNNDDAEAWRSFGHVVGRSMYLIGQCWDPWDFPEVIDTLSNLGHRLLPQTPFARVEQLWKGELLEVSEDYKISAVELNDELIAHLQQADKLVNLKLRGTAPPEPYLVLDDEQEVLIFLGAKIPFEEFRRGRGMDGIHMLRVLIKEPGTFIAGKAIIEQGEKGCEVNQLSSYFSRMRQLIRHTAHAWPKPFRSGPDHDRAWMAFIIPERRKRKKLGRETITDPEGASYKVDLHPGQVRYIPRFPA